MARLRGSIRYRMVIQVFHPVPLPAHFWMFLKSIKRVQYVTATDDEAIEAFIKLSKEEGIVPALEPAHALAYTMKLAKTLDKDDIIVVCLSGRGDKDVDVVIEYLEKKGRKNE